MNLDDAIRYALSGQAVLFAGAGFSSGAINQRNFNLKRGTQLCEYLCKEMGIKPYEDLGYVAQKYMNIKGSDNLIKILSDEYICKNISENHKSLMSIDWKRIYTTNYDNVIETASNQIGNYRIPITLSKKASSCTDNRKSVIHLNGYILDLTPEKLDSEFKLSRNSYTANDDFVNSDWLMLFRQDLENAKAVFFIGYSLRYDIDIQRIMVQTQDLCDKCFFITQKGVDEITYDAMSDFGTVYDIGIDRFTEKVVSMQRNFIPLENNTDNFSCFNYLNTKELNIEHYSSKDVFNLFIKGEINLSHLVNSVGKENYFVNRTYLNRIIYDLDKNFKLAVIHSNLGNGKTCLTYNLAAKLIKRGHVFILDKVNSNFTSELERIVYKDGKKYIIIEDYNLYIEQIKLFRIYHSNDIKFIFTARTYINDVFYIQLTDALKLDEDVIRIYDINILDETEVKNVIDILDNHQLWGRLSTSNHYTKLNKIQKTLKSQFQSILIGLFESDAISSKLGEIIKTFDKNPNVEDIMIVSFINSILNLHLGLDDIIYLLDKIKFSASITRNVALKELLDIKQNEIQIRSSVLALFILKNINKSEKVIDLLVKIMESANRKNFDNTYFNVMRLLISFSNIRLIMKDHGNVLAANIIKYYERIKNLDFNKNNPFFWLQYAIAKLEVKDFAEAKTYFDNAYAYAENINDFDTFQLDSHYARYLLENKLYLNTQDNAFEIFHQAHELIYNNNNKPAHLHYPLKQAKYYLNYYEKFYKSFTMFEQSAFLLFCRQILDKIRLYNSEMAKIHRQKNHDVILAENAINTILRSIEKEIRCVEQTS